MTAGPTLVDGHVHLHACHEIDVALDAALSNFDGARSAHGLPRGTPDVLWLVELEGERSLERIRMSAQRGGRWQAEGFEDVCLRLSRTEDARRITVILGRQVRTAENVEVLIVGTTESIAQDQPVQDTVEVGLEQEALVMLPWAFGKWTGARGRLVASAYDKYASCGLRLADTAARARFLPEPKEFTRSAADGYPVLAGSDPFPFPDQLRRIGALGFVLDDVTADPGWSDIRRAVASLDSQPRRFGQPFRMIEFARLQAKMQLRKRIGAGRSR